MSFFHFNTSLIGFRCFKGVLSVFYKKKTKVLDIALFLNFLSDILSSRSTDNTPSTDNTSLDRDTMPGLEE